MNSLWSWYLDNSIYFWVGLAFGVAFASLFRMSWSAMAGFDVEWDRDRFREKHPKSNWNKATARRYSWLGLGLPLYVIWVAAVILQIQAGFDLRFYFALATLWLVTTPLRNLWLVAVARKVNSSRGVVHEHGLWEEFTQYYEDAFYRPYRTSTEPWFDGRLKFLNVLQKVRLIWLIFNIWGFFGVVGQMLVSLVWPVSAAFAIFYYLHEVEDYGDRRAWWRFTRH